MAQPAAMSGHDRHEQAGRGTDILLGHRSFYPQRQGRHRPERRSNSKKNRVGVETQHGKWSAWLTAYPGTKPRVTRTTTSSGGAPGVRVIPALRVLSFAGRRSVHLRILRTPAYAASRHGTASPSSTAGHARHRGARAVDGRNFEAVNTLGTTTCEQARSRSTRCAAASRRREVRSTPQRRGRDRRLPRRHPFPDDRNAEPNEPELTPALRLLRVDLKTASVDSDENRENSITDHLSGHNARGEGNKFGSGGHCRHEKYICCGHRQLWKDHLLMIDTSRKVSASLLRQRRSVDRVKKDSSSSSGMWSSSRTAS